MSFKEFCNIVLPPNYPFESGRDEDWSKIEARLGTTLPDDFKKFISQFGTGRLGNFIYVLSPFASNEFVNLFNQTHERLDANREIRKDFPEAVPFSLYPEQNGVLPWAFTDNGDVLCWLTKGKPNEWIVVVQESRLAEWEQFSESMSGFLTKLFTGNLSSNILGNHFIQIPITFESSG
jgi:hypothetical protein